MSDLRDTSNMSSNSNEASKPEQDLVLLPATTYQPPSKRQTPRSSHARKDSADLRRALQDPKTPTLCIKDDDLASVSPLDLCEIWPRKQSESTEAKPNFKTIRDDLVFGFEGKLHVDPDTGIMLGEQFRSIDWAARPQDRSTIHCTVILPETKGGVIRRRAERSLSLKENDGKEGKPVSRKLTKSFQKRWLTSHRRTMVLSKDEWRRAADSKVKRTAFGGPKCQRSQ
jgi:hypothetical protein